MFPNRFARLALLTTMCSSRAMATSAHVIVSPSSKHTATVVLLHGLGDSGRGLEDLGHALVSPSLSHVKFILPSAPDRSVSLNGGAVMPAWYDILGLEERAEEDNEGLDESAKTIENILDEENRKGIPYDRMILAGFSQGGAMSLWTGLQLPIDKKVAGIVVMSGYLPGAKRFKVTPGVETTPILQLHGSHDDVVRWAWAEATHKHVTALTKQPSLYTFKRVSGLGHSVNPQEIRDVQEFLKQHLPSQKGSKDL